MKKEGVFRITIVLVFAVFMLGCSGNRKDVSDGRLASVASTETEMTSEMASGEEIEQEDISADGVDVDLTQLSSTMVYSEVYNMMVTPESYVGKTIKMHGQFAVYEAEPGNESGVDYYFAVIIADATACCQQGMEFVWNGEHKFPDDYPKEGSGVTVTGVFETYEEDGQMYCHLLADDIEMD